MTFYRTALIVPLSVITLSGYMSPQTGLVPAPGSRQAMSASQADLSLSCSEIATRSGRLEARLSELEADAKVQRRKDALTDGLMGLGSAVLVGVGARGGVDGLRTAGVAQSGMDAVLIAERGTGQFKSVTDTVAIAQRHSELHRAAIEKGC